MMKGGNEQTNIYSYMTLIIEVHSTMHLMHPCLCHVTTVCVCACACMRVCVCVCVTYWCAFWKLLSNTVL